MDYQAFQALLPAAEQENVDKIWNETAGSAAPLDVCFSGAFSTGKTSLLNCLLQSEILPVALEESTTLPTFISYGPKEVFRLVLQNGTKTLERGDIAETIVYPPAEALFLEAQLPLDWLRGLQVIDLPGTGGMDEKRRAYGREAMRQSDAVIYLLASRGPTQVDLEDLRMLHLLGKKVFVAISHWDEILKCVANGEKMPDLTAWAKEIEYNTGIRAQIVPVNKKGEGSKDVLDFLAACRRDRAALRLARFTAEAVPLLANMIASRRQAIETLAAESEGAKRQARQALLDEQEKLQQLRSAAYQRQQTETESILDKWDAGIADIKPVLEDDLKQNAARWKSANNEDAFYETARSLLEHALQEAAVLGRNLSENYGQLDLQHEDFVQRRINLAPPPGLETGDFLDVGRFCALETQLDGLRKQVESGMSKEEIANMKKELDEREISLMNLQNNFEQLRSLPLPQKEVLIKGSETSAAIGRALGEAGDMLLLLCAPLLAAGKVANVVTKAGRAIGLSVKAAKTAGKVAGSVVETAKTLHGAGTGQNPNTSLAGLEKLEMLTLGYWGEKLGSSFGAQDRRVMRLDNEALDERQKQIEELNRQIARNTQEMQVLERNLHNGAPDVESIQAEMKVVQEQMNRMRAMAEKKKSNAEQDAQEEFKTLLEYEKSSLIREWLRFFTLQTRSMRNLLASMLKNWWEDYVQAQIGEKQAQVEKLSHQLNDLGAQRQQLAAKKEEEITRLEKAAQLLG